MSRGWTYRNGKGKGRSSQHKKFRLTAKIHTFNHSGSKESEDSLHCSWLVPTSFNVSSRPIDWSFEPQSRKCEASSLPKFSANFLISLATSFVDLHMASFTSMEEWKISYDI